MRVSASKLLLGGIILTSVLVFLYNVRLHEKYKPNFWSSTPKHNTVQPPLSVDVDSSGMPAAVTIDDVPPDTESVESSPLNPLIYDIPKLRPSEIKTYVNEQVKAGKMRDPSSFIVAVVSAGRPLYLSYAIRSLQAMSYYNPDNVIVFQYGQSKAVADIAAGAKVQLVQTPPFTTWRNAPLNEGAAHIAAHYHTIMTHVFEKYPKEENFIIVEDDLLFSPDLLLYFAQLEPLLNSDDTLYSVSAYNDNGFHGMARYGNLIHRTDFFIGLGWLVNRRLFTNEWQHRWPQSHWDHWLRSPAQRKGRHVLYPDVPRTLHIGYLGTHSTSGLYEQYFRNIKLHSDAYTLLGIQYKHIQQIDQQYHSNHQTPATRDSDVTLDYLSPALYETFFKKLIESDYAIHTDSLRVLSAVQHRSVVLFYDDNRYPHLYANAIAQFFGVWHNSPIRDAYLGATRFWWNTNHVFLIPKSSVLYNMKANGVQDITSDSFIQAAFRDPFTVEAKNGSLPIWSPPRKPFAFSIIPAKQPGLSCRAVCTAAGYATCDTEFFPLINKCSVMMQHFPCAVCDGSYGFEQPAAIQRIDEATNEPIDVCLVNTFITQYRTNCDATHPATRRLCPCGNIEEVGSVYASEWAAVLAAAQKNSEMAARDSQMADDVTGVRSLDAETDLD